MKGGLAAMMCALKDVEDQDQVRVRLICVPDEESEELDERSTDTAVQRGLGGDFAITGEPTDMHIGVEAKGVLVMRIVVHGRAAHSSTPWLGDNAVLKAVDVFRAIESLPFSRESSEMFDRPSINLGRIEGGDALNMVPDRCEMAVDVRYLPGQDPGEILAQVRAIPGIDVKRTFIHPPVTVSRTNPFVLALREAVSALAARAARPERRPRRCLGRRRHSSRPGSRRSSSAPPAPATTGPRSGSRSRRWRATARRWPTSCARSRPGWRPRQHRRRADGDRGWAGVSLIPSTRGGALWRFLLAAVLVISAVTAATTAVAGLLQFKQLATTISTRRRRFPHATVKIANPGQPQTLLLIGSDHRAGEPLHRRQHRHDDAGPAQCRARRRST